MCSWGVWGQHCKPSPVGSRGKTLEIFWLFCVLNSSKHRSLGSVTRNIDESLHQKSTLLSVWGFEFGIQNRYTGFKIALDSALYWSKFYTKICFVRQIASDDQHHSRPRENIGCKLHFNHLSILLLISLHSTSTIPHTYIAPHPPLCLFKSYHDIITQPHLHSCYTVIHFL